VQGQRVGLRVHHDRREAKLAAGPRNAARYLTAVCNQDFPSRFLACKG
jgi:hypothetical protein